MAHYLTRCNDVVTPFDMDTVASLEAEIERTTQYLQNLRHLLNRLRPACRLPTEIQQMIFKTLKAQYLPSSHAWQRQLSSISQVCQPWRLTAFACPSLWTSIHFRNVMAVDSHISYAQNLPLDVHMDFNHQFLIEPTLELVPQARSFDIHWSTRSALKRVQEKLPEARAPFLQSLKLQDEKWNATKDAGGLRLPSSENAPNLTRISLTCFLFSFDSLNGHNLTAVFMEDLSRSLPDWPTFQGALYGFTQLGVLVLRHSIPEDWKVLEQGPRIALPQLKFLDICDSLSDAARIILPVTLGPCARLRLVQSQGMDCRYNLVQLLMERIVPDLLKTHATARRLHALSFGYHQRSYTLAGWSETCFTTRPVIDFRLGDVGRTLEEPLNVTAAALRIFGSHVQTLTWDRCLVQYAGGHSPFATLEHVSRVNALNMRIPDLSRCLRIGAKDGNLIWLNLTRLDVGVAYLAAARRKQCRSLWTMMMSSTCKLVAVSLPRLTPGPLGPRTLLPALSPAAPSSPLLSLLQRVSEQV
jgi:hypothetical protein